MKGIFHRTAQLTGNANLEKLRKLRVILFGVGGVGSWCAEGLIRSGIEHLTIVDSDRVCATNINRQLQATSKTVGEVKVEVLGKRLREINPDAEIVCLQKIYSAENWEEFNLGSFDYIIDAIDSLSNKVHLISKALETNAVLLSSMGAALKSDPTRIRIDDIWKTKGCPLAKRIRKELRSAGIENGFRCIYSEELMENVPAEISCGTAKCMCPKVKEGPGDQELLNHEWCSLKAQINGSLVHITAIYGFMLAGEIVRDIIGAT